MFGASSKQRILRGVLTACHVRTTATFAPKKCTILVLRMGLSWQWLSVFVCFHSIRRRRRGSVTERPACPSPRYGQLSNILSNIFSPFSRQKEKTSITFTWLPFYRGKTELSVYYDHCIWLGTFWTFCIGYWVSCRGPSSSWPRILSSRACRRRPGLPRAAAPPPPPASAGRRSAWSPATTHRFPPFPYTVHFGKLQPGREMCFPQRKRCDAIFSPETQIARGGKEKPNADNEGERKQTKLKLTLQNIFWKNRLLFFIFHLIPSLVLQRLWIHCRLCRISWKPPSIQQSYLKGCSKRVPCKYNII